MEIDLRYENDQRTLQIRRTLPWWVSFYSPEMTVTPGNSDRFVVIRYSSSGGSSVIVWSRRLWTSMTALLVCLILFFFCFAVVFGYVIHSPPLGILMIAFVLIAFGPRLWLQLLPFRLETQTPDDLPLPYDRY